MIRRVVVDTNLWIRALLGGPVTLPLLEAWRAGQVIVVISQPLLDELKAVAERPRLRQRIASSQLKSLLEQLRWRGEWVEATAVPPRCRDPKDHPVLATALSGRADTIVSGDGDLRADDDLRRQILEQGVQIWGGGDLARRVAPGALSLEPPRLTSTTGRCSQRRVVVAVQQRA